ncbi:MAG: hypothetical protein E7588_01600 [Ruminococcaceae bacterium]|nr:hypothetical protein [Oscillospiraceae bacterium]
MTKKNLNEYRIIDVHCHVFPEKIAQSAANNIGAYYTLPVNGDGTLAGMVNLSQGINICKFVICSAATKAVNVEHANDFIYNTVKSHNNLIGLGTTHADYNDNEKEFERMIQMDMRGIKLHTDFQGFDIDTPKMFTAYKLCEKYRFPVLFHVGDPKCNHSRADKLYNIKQRFPDLIIIAAHMGGYSTKDLAEKYFVGTDVYFDCSEWHNYMSADELVDMIHRHGVDKILFGSDYPLYSAEQTARMLLEQAHLTDEELEKIFYTNAAKLFKINCNNPNH